MAEFCTLCLPNYKTFSFLKYITSTTYLDIVYISKCIAKNHISRKAKKNTL